MPCVCLNVLSEFSRESEFWKAMIHNTLFRTVGNIWLLLYPLSEYLDSNITSRFSKQATAVRQNLLHQVPAWPQCNYGTWF